MSDKIQKLYSVPTIADLFDVGADTVRRWINDGQLPAKKINNRWKVAQSDLEDFSNKRFEEMK